MILLEQLKRQAEQALKNYRAVIREREAAIAERDEAVRLLREIVAPDLGKAGIWKRGYREAVHEAALALLARIDASDRPTVEKDADV